MYIYVYTHIPIYNNYVHTGVIRHILPKLLVSVCFLCSSAKQGKGNTHGKEWVYSSFREPFVFMKSVDVCSQPRVGIESNILNTESSLCLDLWFQLRSHVISIWAPIFSQIHFVESESRIFSRGFYTTVSKLIYGLFEWLSGLYKEQNSKLK